MKYKDIAYELAAWITEGNASFAAIRNRIEIELSVADAKGCVAVTAATGDALKAAIDAAVAEEREECAVLASRMARGYHESQNDYGVNWQVAIAQRDVADHICDSIRARGLK